MSTETQARRVAAAAPHGALQLSANDWEQGYLLPEGPTSIGAGPKCDLRLDGPGLKPLHCVVVLKGDSITVRRWSPGTKLNGSTFTESPLAAGDCLSIGPVDLHVCPVDEAVDEPVEDAIERLAELVQTESEETPSEAPNEPPPAEPEPARLLLAAPSGSPDPPQPEPTLPEAAAAPTATEEEAGADEADSTIEDVASGVREPGAISVAPIPAHLLKPWLDANQPEQAAPVESLIDEGTSPEEAAPPADPASSADADPDRGTPPAGQLTEEGQFAEKSQLAEEAGEAVAPTAEEAMAEEPTDAPQDIGPAAGVEDNPELADPTAEQPAGDDEQNRGGIEFYTDVNWQSVEAGAHLEAGHAPSDAGDSIPTPHPISLAAMLQSREQIAAVRSRAKQLVRTLRAERLAAQESKAELAGFQARCEELAACVAELKASLADRDAQHASLEAEKRALDGELAGLRDAVSSQRSINQELRDQLAEQAEKIATLSTAIENWEAERAALNSELTAAQEQLEQRAALEQQTPANVTDCDPAGAQPADRDQTPQGESAWAPDAPAAAGLGAEDSIQDGGVDAASDDWSVALPQDEPASPQGGEQLASEREPEAAEPAAEADQWLTALKASTLEAETTEGSAPLADEADSPSAGAASSLWAASAVDEEQVSQAEPAGQAQATSPEGSDPWRGPTTLDEQASEDQGGAATSAEQPVGQDNAASESASEEEHPAAAPADLWDIEKSSQSGTPDASPALDGGAASAWAAAAAEPEATSEEGFAASLSEPTKANADNPQPHPTAIEAAAEEPTAWGGPSAPPVESVVQENAPSSSALWGGVDTPEPQADPLAGTREAPSVGGAQPPLNPAEADAQEHRVVSPIPDWLMDDSDDDDEDDEASIAGAAATEEEETGGKFAAPKSFLEQYAHLLPPEDEAEQQEAAPAAFASPPAAPVPQPPTDSGDSDEEDIDAYMSRLMERMRGGSEPASQSAFTPTSFQPGAADPQFSAPEPEPPAPAKKPMLSLDEIKRTAKPEQSTDMASLRRLANDSARQAIGVAASKHSREQSIANLIIATIAMASGGYLISSAPAVFSAQLIGGAFALLLAGVWVFRSVAHLLQAVRTGDFDGALSERLKAEKLPINK